MSAQCFVPYPDDFSPHSSRAYGLRRAGLSARCIADSSPERAEQIANLIAIDSSFKGAVAAEWLKGFKRSGIASLQKRLSGTLDDTARALDQRVRFRLFVPPGDVEDVTRFFENELGANESPELQRDITTLRINGYLDTPEMWFRDLESQARQHLNSLFGADEKVRVSHMLAPMHIDGVCFQHIPCPFPLFGFDGPRADDWSYELKRFPHLLAEPRTYDFENDSLDE